MVTNTHFRRTRRLRTHTIPSNTSCDTQPTKHSAQRICTLRKCLGWKRYPTSTFQVGGTTWETLHVAPHSTNFPEVPVPFTEPSSPAIRIHMLYLFESLSCRKLNVHELSGGVEVTRLEDPLGGIRRLLLKPCFAESFHNQHSEYRTHTHNHPHSQRRALVY